jgi:hypothetical protein
VLKAIAQIDIEASLLTKQRFCAAAEAAMPVVSGVGLTVRLRFYNQPLQEFATLLAFHQQAVDQLAGDQFIGAGEESLGEAGKCLAMGVVAMGVAWEGFVEDGRQGVVVR